MAADRKPRSQLEQLLAVHVAALTVLGALIVGLRHEMPWLPATLAVAAVLAVLLTDWRGIVRLNRWLANAITILAVAWSLRDFWDLSSEEKLMAIGSMLCLLQMVLLFQEKTSRIYWHLVVLSVLQVIVAAALDLGSSSVPLLALFLAVGLGTLMLLCAYRETARARIGEWDLAKWIAKQWQPAMRRVFRLAVVDAAGEGKLNVAKGIAGNSAAARLLLGKPVVESHRTDDAAINHWFNTRLLVRQTGLLTGVTMLFAVVFFYATPRLRDGFSPNGFFFGGSTMGFRPEVRLQRKGRIHLSSRPVMRVKLSRLLDQRTVELVGEPYFHGAILPEYVSDAEGSRWVRPQATNIAGFGGRGILRAVAQTTRSLVRQDIVVEPNVSRRFAIQPTQPIEDATAVFGAGQGGSERVQQQRYAWATPAIVNERQVKAIPNPNRRRNEDEEAAFRDELITATTFPSDRFPRLAAIAAEVVEQNQLTKGRSVDKAEALKRHFLMAGQYQYSLNLNLSSDEEIDPIEDFVANSRSGNCEYFASALTMMLRSQGIPARMVRGYKGGTFNTVGRYYLVQERDAHSWVEAWMPNEEIPSDELAGAPSDGGAWYRFDPTPGRSDQLLIQQPGMGEQLAQAFDYVELLWRDYVLSLNTARQDEIVFDPLTAHAGALPQWVEMRRFRQWLRRFAPVRPGGNGARVFEASTAVAVILALLSFAAAIYVVRLAWEPLTRRRQAQRNSANAAPAFYSRLERVMSRLAVVRKSTQTPREMAVTAGKRLAAIPGETGIAALPGELVGVYYRVRFGKGRLDKVESEAIEQALKKIELAVQRAR